MLAGVLGEGKTVVPGEKTLGARTRTNIKFNPHVRPSPGIELGPHCMVGAECSHHCSIPASHYSSLTHIQWTSTEHARNLGDSINILILVSTLK